LAIHERVRIAQGTYKASGAISVTDGREIEASGVVIEQDGYNDEDSKFNVFQIVGDNVRISGLTIRGNLESPEWTNGQGAGIECSNGVQNVTFENMHFEYTRGFAIHTFTGYRVIVRNCYLDTCGNGLNINASYCEVVDNHLVDSEGIEAEAPYGYIARNHITSALCVGISAGGNTSPGAHVTGMVIEDNEIYGVSDCSGHAIVLADGLDGAIVRRNTVDGADGYGIVTALTTEGTFIWDTLIEDNIFRNVTTYGAILQYHTSITGTVLRGNLIQGNAMLYGIVVNEPGSTVEDNDCRGSGLNADLRFGSTAIGATNEGNLYNTLQDERG
jgi:hypothetical protein